MKFLSVVGLLGWGGGSITGITYTADPTLFGGLPPLGPADLTFFGVNSIYHFKGGVCVNTFLDQEEKELLAKAVTNKREEVDKNWKPGNPKFNDPKGEAKGCAVVSWEQETWRNGTWRGQIRYEWLYKVGNETLISYALYNPLEKDRQGTYEGNVLWRTMYVDKGRKLAAGFIMVLSRKDFLLESPDGSPYWGFNLDLGVGNKNLCRSTIACMEGQRITREFKWSWERDPGGKDRFIDWSKNFTTILDRLISDPKVNLNHFRRLAHERGTWTQR